MSIKLFENFADNKHEFKAEIGSNQVIVDIYNEPGSYRRGNVRSGKIVWEMDIFFRTYGIETGMAKINSMWMVIELEDENGDDYEKEIRIEPGLLKWEQFEQELLNFPLYLESVEISMRHSEDPQDWEFKLYIGTREGY